jgi:3-hydroxyacyl-CoA dehydrogenase/enoyl-CoA hydratase/3-hydroxybutyryl-CoA epimerase
MGIEADQIDQALLAWGMPMGPLRLIDEIGVDVTLDIAATLEKAYGARNRAPAILQKLRDQKMLGRKSGAGFYKYDGRNQTPNESIASSRQTTPEGDAAGMKEGDLSTRLVLLMVNEAARCLEENVVGSAQDADYGMLLGTGFPAYRGGPLRFADSFGLTKVVEELEGLARADAKFAPSRFLQERAASGKKIYED